MRAGWEVLHSARDVNVLCQAHTLTDAWPGLCAHLALAVKEAWRES